MGSLFQGSPQTATSYTTSSTETPKWMQDAIYNQIQVAQNIANAPYQSYDMPTVAELSPLQQQAYKQVQANQGFYQGDLDKAQSGMYDFGSKGTADALKQAQSQYLRQDLVGKNLDAGQGYFDRAGKMDIVAAGQPALSKAMAMDAVGAAQPSLTQAGLAAGNIMGAAQPYLGEARTAAGNITGAAQPYMNQAATAAGNIYNAAQPYMSQAGQTTAEALSDRALSAANPYLTAAAQSAAGGINQYMSPYQGGVMDVLAKQAGRNLSENLLPNVSDAFIKAGQFGGSRMGEFGSRALRDTQEAVLNQQAQLANQGYGQALSASQADLARQAQLAGTVGSISGADLSRVLQGGAQYGNLAQTQGQLTGQQASALANIGQTQGQLSGQQASALANLGQTAGQLTGQQASALTNLGQTTGQLTSQQQQNLTNLGQTQGQLTAQQMSQLGNLGQMQTSAGQAQQQFGLTAAQATQAAQAQDYQRQMSALQNFANMQQQEQAMRSADVAALEGAGAAQQNQMQQQLNAAQQQFVNQQNYPKQQMDWLNTQIRGMAPITPQVTTNTGTTTGATYSPSPLSQLATGLYTYKGLNNLGG
jgi:hypothetical protein